MINRTHILFFLVSFLLTLPTFALSSDAAEGKAIFGLCLACHNQALDPPRGPPMWGVQRRYKNYTSSKQEFIDTMVDFVKAPTKEKVIHDKALEHLGLMPAMPLPDEVLIKIAKYIWEEKFPPPCDHWRIAVRRSKDKGDAEHAKKDAEMLKRFCRETILIAKIQ